MNQHKLRLGFAGNPAFAATILDTLLNSDLHTVKMVLTRQDKPSGRGQKQAMTPVKMLTRRYDIPIYEPQTAADFPDLTSLDLLIVVAYGMRLPAPILKAPRLGCLNVHASLLPRWRGAAPIQRAIQAGDTETGISIMQLDSGLDTGPVAQQRRCSINATETTATLLNKLAHLGSETLSAVLQDLTYSRCKFVAQSEQQAIYASKISKHEAEIDWAHSACDIERMVRAFNPYPIAKCHLHTLQLRIWKAAVVARETPSNARCGQILGAIPAGIDIATGQGILRIQDIQIPGKKVMPASEFINGRQKLLAELMALNTHH